MKRLAYIDGLRAMAALLVYFTHMWGETGAPALGARIAGVQLNLSTIPAVGFIGVNLFLVLSGFCLTWPIANGATIPASLTLGKFLRRRTERIVPAYYASILLVFGLFIGERFLAMKGWWPVSINSIPPVPSLSEVPSHLLLIHNLFAEHALTITGPYWSLALEFQLYILFPLLLTCMLRFRSWKVLVAVLAIQLAYRFSLEAAYPPAVLEAFGMTLPKAFLGRMFDFSIGMAIAYAVAKSAGDERLRKRWHIPSGALAAIFLGGGFYLRCLGGTPDSIMDVIWSFGFASLIYWAAGESAWAHRPLGFGPIAGLGAMSYSLYLMHEPLLVIAGRVIRAHMRPGWGFALGFPLLAVVIAISWILYVTVERPALTFFSRKRKRIMQTNAAPVLAR